MKSETKRSRPVPQRTCFACRQVKPKRELLRIVRTPQGAIEVDLSGKKAGRGTYLCGVQGCWEVGLSKSRLEHALRTPIGGESRRGLLEFGKTLPTGDGGEVDRGWG